MGVENILTAKSEQEAYTINIICNTKEEWNNYHKIFDPMKKLSVNYSGAYVDEIKDKINAPMKKVHRDYKRKSAYSIIHSKEIILS